VPSLLETDAQAEPMPRSQRLEVVVSEMRQSAVVCTCIGRLMVPTPDVCLVRSLHVRRSTDGRAQVCEGNAQHNAGLTDGPSRPWIEDAYLSDKPGNLVHELVNVNTDRQKDAFMAPRAPVNLHAQDSNS
jgi:hypothetical protein